MTIPKKISPIQTRDDFVAFVRALSKDFHDNSQSWENKDLERFLEALASWVEDMDGYYLSKGKAVPKQLDWEIAANMLQAAKMYE